MSSRGTGGEGKEQPPASGGPPEREGVGNHVPAGVKEDELPGPFTGRTPTHKYVT